MITAIERSRFNYLYKYNQIRIDTNQVLDLSIEKLLDMQSFDKNRLVSKLNSIIPIFEQDHEVLLLEIDRSRISIEHGIILSFDAIIGMHPLTQIGKQLLQGKINDGFKVKAPIFEASIEDLKLLRSMNYRSLAVSKLLSHYSINESILGNNISRLIKESTKKAISNTKEFDTYLDYLISYNKTPSFIPEGNIEYICKIGAIVMNTLNKPEENFTGGIYYKFCLEHTQKVNYGNYFDSFEKFVSIANEKIKSSLERVNDECTKELKDLDVFKASYFYIAFKTFLNKNDNNLVGIDAYIKQLIKEDEKVATFVISLLGYTFSFEQLYESIHRLNQAPLFEKVLIPLVSTEISLSPNKSLKTLVQSKTNSVTKPSGKGKTALTEIAKTSDIITQNQIIEQEIHQESEQLAEPRIEYSDSSEKLINEDNNEKKSVLETDTGSKAFSDFKKFIYKNTSTKGKKHWESFIEYAFPDGELISKYLLEDVLSKNPNSNLLFDSKRFTKSKLMSFFE